MRLMDPRGGDGVSVDRETNERAQEYGDTDNRGTNTSGRSDQSSRSSRKKKKKKRRTRSRLKLATLNMRGAGPMGEGGIPEKWLRINQLIRESKIAVLAIQETHLDMERADRLNELFAATMKIIYSEDPHNATGARGVAFAINKRLVDEASIKTKNIRNGRAIMIELNRANARRLRILNVYAPNDPTDNANFWTSLKSEMTRGGTEKPELMLGDFNMVENPMDRLPARRDADRQVEELRSLLTTLDMVDGLRTWDPNWRTFTYMQSATGSQSRLDRIYLKRELSKCAENWEIHQPGLRTDHMTATVSIANYSAPYVGEGRWTIPEVLRKDKIFLDNLKNLGLAAQKELADMGERTVNLNAQIIYAGFKADLKKMARKRAKQSIPRLKREIDALTKDIEEATMRKDSPEEEIVVNTAILKERLAKLEERRFGQARANVAANDWIKGETVSKYWTKLNATPRPCTTINELADPAAEDISSRYSARTERMAEIAKEHYDGIQDDGEIDSIDHRAAVKNSVEELEAKVSTSEKGKMAKKVSRGEVECAIKCAATGKAAGLDGIPAELWKLCAQRAERDGAKDDPAFDIVGMMKKVFNDIETHGVCEGTEFADGWICPIYKKKDQREIANYRPITILNADYKILTKILANRVAEVAANLIHPDQAGFVPGRRIMDHIRLSKLMIDYAEAEEENGMIIALDQEKAYDKINHNYLWAVLKRMNFPENLIETIKSLYKSAESSVMVNGVLSRKFRITRGVRQGDPMSCLLFDLAIEPLACAIRKSEMQGFAIPGTTERLIATLFADDTTTYLSESDNYGVLDRILKKWCCAARAKFNDEKTEYIPIGTTEFRESILDRTSTCTLARTLPVGAKIVEDGSAVRSLGAWIGNRVNEETPWAPIMSTIEKRLMKWAQRNPTILGRKLAVGMEVAGRTQFLATTQEMPAKVTRKLEKMVVDFIWKGNKHPRIGRETLYKSPREGGVGLIDLESRNEAIDLVWLKHYLTKGEKRPRWAYIADRLLARAIVAEDKNVDWEARENCFLQTWRVSDRRGGKTPEDLRRMIRVGRKYGVRADAINPAEKVKDAMPIWYHIGKKEGRSKANTKSAKCLRTTHNVRTVLDARRVASRLNPGGLGAQKHGKGPKCKCHDCDEDRRVRGCDNPSRCAAAAQNMLDNLHPIWKPDGNHGCMQHSRNRSSSNARQGEGRTEYNPCVAEKESIEECMRVFTSDECRTSPVRKCQEWSENLAGGIDVYTDGSAVERGRTTERAGAGIFYGVDDGRNTAAKVPGSKQSNQAAEIYAINVAVARAPPNAPLHIVTDSKYAMDGLTKHSTKWEKRGWLGVSNADLFKETLARLRNRQARTTFKWVKGHDGTIGNEEADELAKRGTSEEGEVVTLAPVNVSLLKNGVSLSELTQRLAYKGIRETKKSGKRKSTSATIERVIRELAEHLKIKAEEGEIWGGIRNRIVARKVRDFMWKTMHDAMRVGKFWKNIEGYEERGVCKVCGAVDSMEHILMACKVPGQSLIWSMVKDTLTRKGAGNIPLTYGTVLGSVVIKRDTEGDSKRQEINRLCKILIPEAAYLIWKIRCERVIQNDNKKEKWLPEKAIRAKWLRTMEKRAQMDWAEAAREKGRKHRKRTSVEKTWKDVVNETHTHETRRRRARVLVGSPERASGIG